MSLRRRHRNEQGAVLPTRLMVLSISVVALAGLVFIATQGSSSPDKAAPAAVSTKSATKGPTLHAPGADDTPVVPTPTTPTPKPVDRAHTDVVVFNNTNIKGLAGATATVVSAHGWNMITTDNWHGSVDASTVYYGPRLKAAAQLLATDLKIGRIKPSFAPMNPKQLTVILTTDYH
ncbi:MAG TPA: LytR C-terminal domain-containing protein [Marmoricola sp.]|jgi:hypothetical protein|nr:LytR C-terminal domain-containing protein [Marmoricola sp.]